MSTAVWLLVLPALLVVPAQLDPFLVPKTAAFQLGALGLLVSRARGSHLISGGQLAGALLVGIGLFTSAARLSGVSAWATLALCFPLLGLLARESATLWVRSALALGALQSLLGLAQRAWLPDPAGFESLPARMKLVGTFGNPEYVASYLGMALCLGLFPGAGLTRAERLGFCAILGMGLLATGSQGAVLALLATLGIVTALRHPRAIPALLLLGLGGLALLARWPDWHLHTLRGRWLLWRIALEVFRSSPWVGVGREALGDHFLDAQRAVLALPGWRSFSANAAFTPRAHNEYLDFLTEGGIVLALPLAAFVLPLLRRALRAESLRSLPAVSAILVFTLLDALVSFPLHLIPTLVLVLFAASRFPAPPAPIRVLLPAPTRRAGLIFAALLLGAVQFSLLGAGYLGQKAQSAAEREAFLGARHEVTRALRLTPHDPELLLLKARLEYSRLRPRTALRTLDEMERVGKRIDSLKLRGLALQDLRRIDEAIRVYRELEATLPWQITSRYYLGRLYREKGDTQEARRQWLTALSLRPTNPKAKLDQARAAEGLAAISPRP
jgi:tetratricopeptide (TPR) repeat protein